MKDDLRSKSENSLTGLTPDEIASVTGIKQKYRNRQIAEWLIKGVESFDEMTNLPAALRTELSEKYRIFSSKIKTIETGDDGTVKAAFELSDGELIEAVLLTDENGRKTACISSQVGCAMGCSFCRTGRMGFRRNLDSKEIIEQYVQLRNYAGDIGNIVYMGMGEPLKNLAEVEKSILFFTSEEGLNMSARRLTVSTCGIVEGIKRLGRGIPPVRLAVSLVTADPQKRSEIMPVNITNSLEALKAALLDYQESGGRRITLECAVIKGINDSAEAASEICDWAEGLSVNVNVIPWNPASEIDYEEPSAKKLERSSADSWKKEKSPTPAVTGGAGDSMQPAVSWL